MRSCLIIILLTLILLVLSGKNLGDILGTVGAIGLWVVGFAILMVFFLYLKKNL